MQESYPLLPRHSRRSLRNPYRSDSRAYEWRIVELNQALLIGLDTVRVMDAAVDEAERNQQKGSDGDDHDEED